LSAEIQRASIADANQRMLELLEVHRQEGDDSPAPAAQRWFEAQGIDVKDLKDYTEFVARNHVQALYERARASGKPIDLGSTIFSAFSQGVAFGWLLHQLHGEDVS
jgi:hypothetical protein